jgi:hypothetical protein
LLATKTVKVERKNKNRESLWNEIPLLGREAMIAIFDDEQKLIRALKAENEEEYNKLYLLKSGTRRRHRSEIAERGTIRTLEHQSSITL